MRLRPPKTTRTDTLCPDPTLFRSEGVDVLVTDGVVETWTEGHEAARTRIAQGERSFVAAGTRDIVAVKAADEIDRALAWRSGGLAFNGEPLSYAVAELNRYNRRKLVVEDPVLARMPIVGSFRTDEPDDFARTVAPLIGAREIGRAPWRERGGTYV